MLDRRTDGPMMAYPWNLRTFLVFHILIYTLLTIRPIRCNVFVSIDQLKGIPLFTGRRVCDLMAHILLTADEPVAAISYHYDPNQHFYLYSTDRIYCNPKVSTEHHPSQIGFEFFNPTQLCGTSVSSSCETRLSFTSGNASEKNREYSSGYALMSIGGMITPARLLRVNLQTRADTPARFALLVYMLIPSHNGGYCPFGFQLCIGNTLCIPKTLACMANLNVCTDGSGLTCSKDTKSNEEPPNTSNSGTVLAVVLTIFAVTLIVIVFVVLKCCHEAGRRSVPSRPATPSGTGRPRTPTASVVWTSSSDDGGVTNSGFDDDHHSVSVPSSGPHHEELPPSYESVIADTDKYRVSAVYV